MHRITVLKARWICLLFVVVCFFSTPTFAQIGDLGIYGSAPSPGMPTIRYVRLQSLTSSLDYTIPLNGASNFNFYYAPDGLDFLGGGSYVVNYLGADRTTTYGSATVSYSPDPGATTGYKVSPFNSVPASPLGIYGTVLAYVTDLSGTHVEPLQNAFVRASAVGGATVVHGKTNGNGFFSFYYTNGTEQSFLPVSATFFYRILIAGDIGNCSYTYLTDVGWAPSNTTDPSSSTYYVNGASSDSFIPTLSPDTCN